MQGYGLGLWFLLQCLTLQVHAPWFEVQCLGLRNAITQQFWKAKYKPNWSLKPVLESSTVSTRCCILNRPLYSNWLKFEDTINPALEKEKETLTQKSLHLSAEPKPRVNNYLLVNSNHQQKKKASKYLPRKNKRFAPQRKTTPKHLQ